MKKLFILVLLLASIAAQAQFSSGTAKRIVSGATIPAHCAPGDVFFKTTATIGQYNCNTTDNWTAVGTGGGGGNDVPIQPQITVTSNQLKGLAGTPKTLLPQPGSGFFWKVLGYTVQYKAGGTPYTIPASGPKIHFGYTGLLTALDPIFAPFNPAGFFDQATNQLVDIAVATGFSPLQQPQTALDNTAVLMSMDQFGGVGTNAANAPGSGYAALDVLTVDGTSGTPATLRVDTVDGSGAVTGYTKTGAGTGYITGNGVATSTDGAAGTGYAQNDTFTVDGGTVTLATGHITSVNGTGGATGIAIDTPGAGYSIANGVGTTATLGGGSGLKINITALTSTGPIVQLDGTGTPFTPAAGGSNYKVSDVGQVNSDSNDAKFQVTTTDASPFGAVTAYILTNNGTAYVVGSAPLFGTGSPPRTDPDGTGYVGAPPPNGDYAQVTGGGDGNAVVHVYSADLGGKFSDVDYISGGAGYSASVRYTTTCLGAGAILAAAPHGASSGLNFLVNDTFSIDTGSGTAIGKVTATNIGTGAVTGFILTNRGSGYSTGNSQATTATGGSSGTGLAVDVNTVTINACAGTGGTVIFNSVDGNGTPDGAESGISGFGTGANANVTQISPGISTADIRKGSSFTIDIATVSPLDEMTLGDGTAVVTVEAAKVPLP